MLIIHQICTNISSSKMNVRRERYNVGETPRFGCRFCVNIARSLVGLSVLSWLCFGFIRSTFMMLYMLASLKRIYWSPMDKKSPLFLFLTITKLIINSRSAGCVGNLSFFQLPIQPQIRSCSLCRRHDCSLIQPYTRPI